MAMKSTDFHKVSKDDLLKYFPRGCGLNPSDLPDRNDRIAPMINDTGGVKSLRQDS
jgi:hypothetical protein